MGILRTTNKKTRNTNIEIRKKNLVICLDYKENIPDTAIVRQKIAIFGLSFFRKVIYIYSFYYKCIFNGYTDIISY